MLFAVSVSSVICKTYKLNLDPVLVFSNPFLFVDPDTLAGSGGLLLIFLLVFGSTGLFFCFFIPSGAVLFTSGILTASGELPYNIYIVCSVLILASQLGSLAGYGFGWKAGELLYRRRDSRFFRKQHLLAAENFYKKYGRSALTSGYYLPIIRTFAPVVAGMVQMKLRRFILLTFSGSVFWVLGFVLSGFFIGSRPLLKPYLKYIIIAFVLFITVPLFVKLIREMRKIKKNE